MNLVENYFDIMYDLECYGQVTRIQQLCYDLVSEYQLRKNEGFASSSPSNVGKFSFDNMTDFQMYMARKKRSKPSSMKTELDHFLEDNLSITLDFEILAWWKQNEGKVSNSTSNYKRCIRGCLVCLFSIFIFTENRK